MKRIVWMVMMLVGGVIGACSSSAEHEDESPTSLSLTDAGTDALVTPKSNFAFR